MITTLLQLQAYYVSQFFAMGSYESIKQRLMSDELLLNMELEFSTTIDNIIESVWHVCTTAYHYRCKRLQKYVKRARKLVLDGE
jgi:hypothetical protein